MELISFILILAAVIVFVIVAWTTKSLTAAGLALLALALMLHFVWRSADPDVCAGDCPADAPG